MRSSQAFLQCVAWAARSAVGNDPAGKLPVEALPGLARDVWASWGKGRPEAELRAELQRVAQLTCAEARAQATAVLAAEAGLPAAVRQTLLAYLTQVPASLRRSLKRPKDPSGKTVPSSLGLRRPEDLLPLLPERLPRFQPGDRPPGIGDWVLEELLGVGGFGEVWKATNPHLRSAAPVALKFCLGPAAKVLRHEAAVLDRVMREGKHPGIVQLLRTHLGAQEPCLEYELIEGGDLAGVIQAWARQPHRSPGQRALEAARVVRKLAEIVGFAHRLSPPIVHRDLKPANVLVQRGADGSLHLKVADFGIGGVAAGHALSQSNHGATRATMSATAVRGAYTPLYASPQQVRGAAPDPRDDVFALGVIWYQLLTGDLTQGRPGGSRWRDPLAAAGVPGGMLVLLESCFEEQPGDRPANAAELAEEIDVVLVLAGAREARPAEDVPAERPRAPQAGAGPVSPPALAARPSPVVPPVAAPEGGRYRQLRFAALVADLSRCHQNVRWLKGGRLTTALVVGILLGLALGLLGGQMAGSAMFSALRPRFPDARPSVSGEDLRRDLARSREYDDRRDRARSLGIAAGVLTGCGLLGGSIWLQLRLRRKALARAEQELSARINELLADFPQECLSLGGASFLHDPALLQALVPSVARDLEAGHGPAGR